MNVGRKDISYQGITVRIKSEGSHGDLKGWKKSSTFTVSLFCRKQRDQERNMALRDVTSYQYHVMVIIERVGYIAPGTAN